MLRYLRNRGQTKKEKKTGETKEIKVQLIFEAYLRLASAQVLLDDHLQTF